MNPRVLKRFVIYMIVFMILLVIGTDLIRSYVTRAPGDYHTERGDQLLSSRNLEGALEEFDLALREEPDHRGAIMGRAVVFVQSERYDEAMAELDYLIGYLGETLEDDDVTGHGTLAAAYANRGILHDRLGRHEAALEDYIEALRVDEGAVSGPGLIHELLYKQTGPVSSVVDRARYLYEQFQLPEDQRLLSVPELDAEQRIYKP
jgi:tetratricopeptide (TPR) repeat protein